MNESNFIGDEPGVNWLVHVLVNNVGKNEWVPKSPEEQAEYDKKFPFDKSYPYKVITHPIPEGEILKFECSKPYAIACSDLKIREYLIGIAQRLEWYRNEYYRLSRDVEPWVPASEWPDTPISACRKRVVQVDSSALRFLGMFFLGYHDYSDDSWYVILNNKPVKHKVEQWRRLPYAPCEGSPYESVKEEIERLKKEMI